jgi:hypothetical protein
MAIVLDATPGGPNANSFATREQAAEYFSGRLYGEFWDEVPDDTQNRALITATRLIVEAFNRIGWQGYRVSNSQRLPIPRTGMVTPEGYAITAFPDALVNATAEYAGRLVEAGRMPDAPSDTEGMKSFEAGPISVEWSEGGGPEQTTDLPDAVYAMISYLGVRVNRMSVPLVRS